MATKSNATFSPNNNLDFYVIYLQKSGEHDFSLSDVQILFKKDCWVNASRQSLFWKEMYGSEVGDTGRKSRCE